MAAHRPDIIVAEYRGVVDDYFFSGSNSPGGEEEEAIVGFADRRVRIARMIEKAARPELRVKICLGSEPEAVIRERSANSRHQGRVDDPAADPGDEPLRRK